MLINLYLKSFLFSVIFITTPKILYASPYLERKEVKQFIMQMVEQHQFNPTDLTKLFQTVKQDPIVLQKIQKPAENLPWHVYRPLFIKPSRITEGAMFWKKYSACLTQAENDYGVPAKIIVAILGVETNYGRTQGNHRVLDTLTTLSFDYPPRADFFKKELEHFLLFFKKKTNRMNLMTIKGSYAGAMGIPQFISSSYQRFGIDSHSKGYSDLTNIQDAIFSVANYLQQHGWVKGNPVTMPANIKQGAVLSLTTQEAILREEEKSFTQWAQHHLYLAQPNLLKPITPPIHSARLIELEGQQGLEYWFTFPNFSVIKKYNKSPLYAMVVWQLSQLIEDEYQRSSQ